MIGSEQTGASEIIVDAGPEHRPTPATELLRGEATDVRAEHVNMEQSGAEKVTAERVVMTNSGARTVEARSAQVDRSGILVVNAEKSVFTNSTAVGVMSEETRIVRSPVFLLKTNSAAIEGDARIAVYAGPPNDALRPVVDARGAAAFGAGVGLVLLVLGMMLRRLFAGQGRGT